MAQSRKMEPEEARKLKEAGWTHARIAEKAGLTVSGVQQLLGSVGAVKKYVSHKEVFPFRVQKQHAGSGVATYLRRLSRLSQGLDLQSTTRANEWAIKTAVNWANEIIDKGQDYDYDENEPPNDFCPAGGFFLRTADEADWKLKKLMVRVLAARTRKPIS